jgi:Ras-related protein Rab-18
MREVEAYATVDAAVKMVVGNKADMEAAREVPRAEGEAFARRHGCLFAETSAKLGLAVGQAFEELVLKALDTPALLAGPGGGLAVGGAAPGRTASSCC